MRTGLAAAGALALLASCAGPAPRSTVLEPELGLAELADPAAERPRLRLSNGQVTLNDRCMVRELKLNPRIPPVFVNGFPVGFC